MAETSLNIQYLLKYPCYHRRCYETVYVLFSAYTLCGKKNTLSMRPYIETVFFFRIHSNSTTVASDNSREFLNSLIVFDYIVSAETPDRLCAICSSSLHAFDPVYALPCAHLFHVGCLRPWVRVKTSCPCPECKKEFN